MKKLVSFLAIFFLLSFASPVVAAECKPAVSVVEMFLSIPESSNLETLRGDSAQAWITRAGIDAQVDMLVVLVTPQVPEYLIIASYKGCYVGHIVVPKDIYKQIRGTAS